jgi:hypothetical protein
MELTPLAQCIKTAPVRLWGPFADVAFGTAQYVDVGTVVGALKDAGHDDFTFFQEAATDRTYPGLVSVQAVDAAFDVHEPVFAAVQRGDDQGLYQFARRELHRTNRAVPGICPGRARTGRRRTVGLQIVGIVPFFPSPASGVFAGRGLQDDIIEESKAKPEEGYDGDDKQ